jgi:DinB family protein
MSEDHQALVERLEAQCSEVEWVVTTFPEDKVLLDPERGEPASPHEGEWSALIALAHLTTAEQHIFLPRIEKLVASSGIHFESMAGDQLFNDYLAQAPSLRQTLLLYTSARQRIIRHLKAAAPDAWSHTATHSHFGEHTLAWWGHYVYWHSMDHLAQILKARNALTK